MNVIIVDMDKIPADMASHIYQKIIEKTGTDDWMMLPKEEYKYLKFAADKFDPFWFCSFGGCEGACKECKNTCEMSLFVKERKQVLIDLHAEFSRYKCYEHADEYLRKYAKKCGIDLEV